ncbi:MAG: 3'-5' exonuclease [Candidatus Izemoplasmatales bacterium]|nr:3'-5' exonuclease [Candidatus Izemoplasmatales bacterium]
MLFENKYQNVIIFDCETTGLNLAADRVVEIACCKLSLVSGDYSVTDQFDKLINIHQPLPTRIIELTGISNQMITENGIEEKAVVSEFYLRFLSESGNSLFIAYNAPFDIGFIGAMLSRNGLSFPRNPSFLDALTVYKDRAPYPHRLENAIKHYNLEQIATNSHRAICDVMATYEVLKAMNLEKDDLHRYVNLFGYNPNYPIRNRIDGVKYRPQPYGSKQALYEK